MADRNLSLGVDVDSSVQKAKQRLQELEKAQLELATSFKRGDIDADAFAKSLSDIEREAKSLNKVLDALEKPREIDVKTENFDRVSKDVGLAGDIQSNLGAAAGLANIAGAQGLGQGIGAVGEIAALVEELPRLKTALSGLPQTLGAAAQALGPVGIGVTALGAAAIAAALVIANAIAKVDEENARQSKSATEAFADLQREIASGELTTEEARKRIEELNKQRETEQRILDANKQTYDEYIRKNQAADLALKIFSADEEALAESTKKAQETVTDIDQSIQGLEAALDSGATAAADMIAKEQELAQIRLSDAALAGELARLQAESSDLSREEIENRQRQLELQRIQLEAELAALKSQGDLTQAELDRIAQIEDALDSLSQKNDVLESAKASAQSEEELKASREESTSATKEATDAESSKAQADREAAQAAQEAQRAQEQMSQAQDKFTQSVKDAKTKLTQAFQDIQTDLARGLTDNQTDLTRKLTDVNTQFNRDELSRVRQHGRDLKQLRKSADEAEKDALRTRNFLQLADARKEAKDAVDLANEELKNEGEDRLIEAQNQRLDLADEAKRTTTDLRIEAQRREQDARLQRDRSVMAAREQLNIQQQTLNQSLNIMARWGQEFLKIQQQALANRQGTSRYDTSNVSQNSSTSIFEQVRYGTNL